MSLIDKIIRKVNRMERDKWIEVGYLESQRGKVFPDISPRSLKEWLRKVKAQGNG